VLWQKGKGMVDKLLAICGSSSSSNKQQMKKKKKGENKKPNQRLASV